MGVPTDLIFFSTPSTIWWWSRVEAVGISVFVLRDMSLCTGLDPMVSTGVFLYSNRASHGSLLSRRAFLNKFLVTFTADSALPLALGGYGEGVTCLNSHSSANHLNLWLTSCGPLSDMRKSVWNDAEVHTWSFSNEEYWTQPTRIKETCYPIRQYNHLWSTLLQIYFCKHVEQTNRGPQVNNIP